MTHHMHSLRHGIVYGTPPVAPRSIGALCQRHPNKVLAVAHAGQTMANALTTLWLASMGLDVGMVLCLHYVQVYVLGVPMHALTLHLSKVQDNRKG